MCSYTDEEIQQLLESCLVEERSRPVTSTIESLAKNVDGDVLQGAIQQIYDDRARVMFARDLLPVAATLEEVSLLSDRNLADEILLSLVHQTLADDQSEQSLSIASLIQSPYTRVIVLLDIARDLEDRL